MLMEMQVERGVWPSKPDTEASPVPVISHCMGAASSCAPCTSQRLTC